jgi:hypothetical protein
MRCAAESQSIELDEVGRFSQELVKSWSRGRQWELYLFVAEFIDVLL